MITIQNELCQQCQSLPLWPAMLDLLGKENTSARKRWREGGKDGQKMDFKRKNVRSHGKPSAFKVPHLDFI